LENNVLKNAFTEERLKVLSILDSQTAISIDNAKSYENLESKVEQRTHELQESNNKIMDSIHYSKFIQSSILPQKEVMKSVTTDHFAFWKPKNIVGGDIYWLEKLNNESFLIAVIDCTGHGVSGALMTMMANSTLKQVVTEQNSNNPAEILNALNIQVRKTLKHGSDAKSLGLLGIARALDTKNQRKISYIPIRKSKLMEMNSFM
jgi:serine phosphatase RsbU (regulator of sigma subunit)